MRQNVQVGGGAGAGVEGWEAAWPREAGECPTARSLRWKWLSDLWCIEDEKRERR